MIINMIVCDGHAAVYLVAVCFVVLLLAANSSSTYISMYSIDIYF